MRSIRVVLAILVLVGALAASPVHAGCEYWQCVQFSEPVSASCYLRYGDATNDYAIACRARCYRYSDGSVGYCKCLYDYCYMI